MPQYLLSVWHDDGYPDPTTDEMQQMFTDVGAFNQRLQEAGSWVFADGLESHESATVVRVVDGQVSMTDGPYSEAKEQVGGFWIIQAADLDAALEWAKQGATACRAPVEVRPFQAR